MRPGRQPDRSLSNIAPRQAWLARTGDRGGGCAELIVSAGAADAGAGGYPAPAKHPHLGATLLYNWTSKRGIPPFLGSAMQAHLLVRRTCQARLRQRPDCQPGRKACRLVTRAHRYGWANTWPATSRHCLAGAWTTLGENSLSFVKVRAGAAARSRDSCGWRTLRAQDVDCRPEGRQSGKQSFVRVPARSGNRNLLIACGRRVFCRKIPVVL